MARELYAGDDDLKRKEDFVKRLEGILKDKGWNKSELARRAGISRDRTSVYCRLNNTTLPSAMNLSKIASALGINPIELLPEAIAADNYGELEPFAMKDVPGKEGMVFLQINQEVPKKKALQVALLLED